MLIDGAGCHDTVKGGIRCFSVELLRGFVG